MMFDSGCFHDLLTPSLLVSAPFQVLLNYLPLDRTIWTSFLKKQR